MIKQSKSNNSIMMRFKSLLTKSLLLVCVLCTSHSLAAVANNKPLSLSLSEAIQLALRNNPSVESAELQRVIDKFALEVADNEFEWRYRLNGNVLWSQIDANGNSTHSHSASLIPEASIKSSLGTEFNASFAQNSPDGSHYNPSLRFSAKQPLLRGAGSEVNLASWRNSYDQEEVNKLNLKNTIISTVNTVIRDYHDLQQAQWAVQIQENNLRDIKENRRQTQAKIDAGKLPPRDIVEIRRQIAEQELQLETAKNSRDQRELILLRDLWLDPTATLSLPKDIDSTLEKIPELAPSFELALKFNIPYQIALINVEQLKRALIVAEDNQRWQLDLSASHSRGGGNGGGDNARLDSLFNGRNDATRAQLDLNIPIDDKPRQQSLVNAKINLKQAQLRIELLKRELYDSIKITIQNLDSQRKQVTLADEATELARQSLALEQQKLLYGKATQLDVTQSRRTLINAENNSVRAKITYLKSLVQFRELLGVTLDHWQVEVVY